MKFLNKMSLFNLVDIDYYLFQFYDLKTCINLLLLNQQSYYLIVNLPFYQQLLTIKNSQFKMDEIFRNGYLSLIKILSNDKNIKFTDNNTNLICCYGHVDILNWLIKSNIEFEYSIDVLDFVAGNGHINVLEWWKNNSINNGDFRNQTKYFNSGIKLNSSKLEFRYTKYAINFASLKGYLNVINWFKNSNFKIKYTHYAIDWAAEFGHLHILDWFYHSGLKIKYTHCAIDKAAGNGRTIILEWFKKTGLEFKYTSNAIDVAAASGYLNILIWFSQSGFEFKYTNSAIIFAAGNGHLDILKWFNYQNIKIEKKQLNRAIKYASNNNHYQCVEWLQNNYLNDLIKN